MADAANTSFLGSPWQMRLGLPWPVQWSRQFLRGAQERFRAFSKWMGFRCHREKRARRSTLVKHARPRRLPRPAAPTKKIRLGTPEMSSRGAQRRGDLHDRAHLYGARHVAALLAMTKAGDASIFIQGGSAEGRWRTNKKIGLDRPHLSSRGAQRHGDPHKGGLGHGGRHVAALLAMTRAGDASGRRRFGFHHAGSAADRY
jgi:hypothetical protein